ncbi:MAG: GumC family protein [Methylovirgula sp.]
MPSLVPINRQPVSRDLRFAAPNELGDGTADVADIWRILWHRRIWLFAIAGILAGITLLYCLLTPSIYFAKAQILVDPRDRQIVSSDTNQGTVAADSGVTQAESQVSIVQSTDVLMRAIVATHLTNDPEFNRVGLLGHVTGLLREMVGKSPMKPGEAEERILSALRRHLTVSRADKVLVVDIGVKAEDPNKAAQLANAIADAYLAEQASARAQAVRKLSNELTANLAAQRERVQTAADAVERYRAEHNMVVATGQLVSEQQLADVNRQLIDAQNRAALLKARLDQINRQRAAGVPADAIPEVMQSTVISQLRAQEGILVQREANLESQLGPLHPALTAVRSQLRDIRRLINVQLNRIAKSAQADYNAAAANQHVLTLKLQNLKKETLSTDQAAIRLRELQRDLAAVRTVYSSYLVRAQEARQQANVDSTNARVITRAFPPLQKSWPPTGLLLFGALIAGLGLGAGVALLVESLAPTVLSIGQAETLTDAPLVGILPPAGGRVRHPLLAWPPGKTRQAVVGHASRSSGAAHIEAVIDLTLRRIFSANPPPEDRAYVRSVLVTSGVGDAQERDRVARLLAEVAAGRGERVLMVDADLAGDQESQTAGLLDVLRGERAFDTVLYFEPGSNAAFVAKGRRQAMSSERGSYVFARRMLVEARHQFDLVVVNGGAAVENLKAAPLAAAADEVLMVVRRNVTPRREVEAATEALSVMGCSVTAVLLVDSMAEA